MVTYWQGKRVKKHRYELGTLVFIRGLKGGPYKVTHMEYREYQNKWAYVVNGKHWFETSLRKAPRRR